MIEVKLDIDMPMGGTSCPNILLLATSIACHCCSALPMCLATSPHGGCDDLIRRHRSELAPAPELALDGRVEKRPLQVAAPLSASQPKDEQLPLATKSLLLRAPQILRVVERQILEDGLPRLAAALPQRRRLHLHHPQRRTERGAGEQDVGPAVLQGGVEEGKLQQKTREVDGTPADLNIRRTAPQLPGEGQRRWNTHLEVEPREDLILALQDGTQLNLAMADVAENPLPMPRRELVCARELHLRADRTQQNSLHVRGLDGPREGRVEAVESEHDAVQDGVVEPERSEGLHHPIYQLCPLAPADGRAELLLPPRPHAFGELMLGAKDRVNEITEHSGDGDVGVVGPAELPDAARDVGGAVDDELHDDQAVDAGQGRV
mmetsp:Transcript_179962/g.571023  ORF Transcript_179962/g.571023 Transcript_179962/m.571023 type:complete len:377 (+) Transcript_179962:589-1719(+)